MTFDQVQQEQKRSAWNHLQELLKDVDLKTAHPEEIKRLMVAVYQGQDLFYKDESEEDAKVDSNS